MALSTQVQRLSVGLAASAVVVGGLVAPAQARPDGLSQTDPTATASGWRSHRLAAELRKAVVDQHWDEVLDKAPPGTPAAKRIAALADDKYEHVAGVPATRFAGAAPARIHQMPNVDATVIELGRDGRTLAAANVLLSPQYPDGQIVPLDKNLATDQVRWRRWDDAGWDANNGQGTVDAVPGRESAPLDFMSPYPASVLKVMVGFGILQLVDRGEIALDDEYAYDRTGAPNTACGLNVTKTIRQFFDEMITFSSNESTCALIKLLHQRGEMDPLNKRFQDLGLPMLQLIKTRPVDGGGWGNTQMNALDTAKLLMMINGGPGRLWTAPDGTAVTKDVLSDASRKFFLTELAEQGFNMVTSTTNWCGREYPAPGIPQRTAERWINPTDGTMTVAGRVFGQDVRPCQGRAEVAFLHKTGRVDTSGNEAGIVRSLPGKAGRRYIVAVHANLGDRYIDPNRPADPPGTYPVPFTEKYAKLGLAIDRIVTRHCNP